MSSITDAIDQVAATVRRGGAGTEKPWAGAEVIICEKAPRTSNSGDWRTDPRYVETNFVGELEVSELAEIFQWMTAEEAANVMKNQKSADAVKDELADIALYLVRLSAIIKVDLVAEANAKIDRNEKRFPPTKC